MRKTLACCALALATSIAQAEPLWGQAEHGASTAEISKLFPEGASVTPTERQRFDNGAMLRYELKNVEILDKKFNAGFYFLKDSLTHVSLGWKSEDPIYSCELTTQKVQEALRAKYGADLTSTRSGGLGVIRGASWTSGKTTISLTMFAFDDSCSVSIVYNARLAEAGSKL